MEKPKLDTDKIIEEITSSISNYDQLRMIDSVKVAFDHPEISIEEIRKAIMDGIDSRRAELLSPSGSLPEYLLSVDVLSTGLELLRKLAGPAENEKHRTAVIGVISGDVHELGKNIVVSVFRACGWEVVDLGIGAGAAQFADAAVEYQADVVGISCMMSTPLDNAKNAVDEVRHVYPKAAIMVGGAAIGREMAENIGADGWAESAVTLLDETQKALGKRP